MKTNKINGPVNVVRMEGKINNIHKVIYLFMDIHLNISEQTKCNGIGSVDIQNFFKESFENLDQNKTYDFFMEIFPEYLSPLTNLEILNKPESQMIYLRRLQKFFYDHIRFDPEKNKISSLFKNVRLHYIDIRGLLYDVLLDPLLFAIERTKEQHEKVPSMVETSIFFVIKFMKNMETILQKKEGQSLNIKQTKKQSVVKLEDNIFSILQDSDVRKEYMEKILYLFNKFLNDYRHDNIKKLVNEYIDSYLIPRWQRYITDLENFYDKIKNLKQEDYQDDKMTAELRKELSFLRQKLFSMLSRIVDLYFIRRFLDKDYIMNAMVYTGAAHSSSYIYLLHRIGFKITHCANCPIKNINKLNEAVDQIKNFPSEQSLFDLLEIFIPKKQVQCTDISKFPKDFQ